MMSKASISRLHATLHGRYWREQLAKIRHCVECGGVLKIVFVREEGCRRRRCERCMAITYINPRVVAGCVPMLPDGRVVLLKRSIEPARGKWSYPAGYMEMGETVEEAARRETMEEIGVPVKLIDQIGIYSYPDAGVVTVVYAGWVTGKKKPRVTDESLDVRAVEHNRIPWDLLAFRSTTHAIEDWLKWRKNNVA
jgi:ADP-ribose pyrophosphatase YjhB (NUDIX family)